MSDDQQQHGVGEWIEPDRLPLAAPTMAEVIAYGSSTIQRTRNPGWSKAAKEYLETHGHCIVCGTTKFLVVHHRKPFHLFAHLEMLESNWAPICETPSHNCHFIFVTC